MPTSASPTRSSESGSRRCKQDFFLARTFRNLDHLNVQLDDWLATVSNVRLHGMTQRIVAEAFGVEQPELQPLPAAPFGELLKLAAMMV